MFKRWPMLEKQLAEAIGDFNTVITNYPNHATHITRELLSQGYERIIAVGGDGTVSQVVNGFFSADTHKSPLNENAILGVLSSGTGCDTARTMPIGKGFDQQVQTLKKGQVKKLDLGQVETTLSDGSTYVQLFINICSFGLSGEVVAAVNKGGGGKAISGRFAYLLGAMKALVTSKNRRVKMLVDGEKLEETIAVVGVANGAFCGGGIHLAPMAKMDDGCLEAIVVGDVGLYDLLKYMKRLFQGRHLVHPKINHYPVRKFSATVAGDDDGLVCVETDGEPVGYLPCIIDIRAKAIKVQLQN